MWENASEQLIITDTPKQYQNIVKKRKKHESRCLANSLNCDRNANDFADNNIAIPSMTIKIIYLYFENKYIQYFLFITSIIIDKWLFWDPLINELNTLLKTVNDLIT